MCFFLISQGKRRECCPFLSWILQRRRKATTCRGHGGGQLRLASFPSMLTEIPSSELALDVGRWVVSCWENLMNDNWNLWGADTGT